MVDSVITYTILGLSLLTIICFMNKLKWATVFVIPIAFLCYYSYVSNLPKQLGYPVDWNLTESEEATFLYGTEGKDFLYMTVLEKDLRVPRLIQMVNTKENREGLQKLIKKQQEGRTASIGRGNPNDSQDENKIGDFSVQDGAAGSAEETK
ncbi:hypothetical protein PP939_gp199 [Rhizobium phage RL38J1]|uniref:Uncharacterized protein n=1 Tax=Rhizobium phage RL38J1 TaxID=2663232 RepID=A0A6B9J6N4_9CAUD|nr:hypothetical protein PP939_gp199 [Rhizobium phage RL38J1]QGZ13931.1 hypothetical protein RL38J1_199 [Rhizobium phage RL38J1]